MIFQNSCRMKMAFPSGPFVWKRCRRCLKFEDPIVTSGKEVSCTWCGSFFKNCTIRCTLHPRRCPRGPNLGQTASFDWRAVKCSCEEDAELREILETFNLAQTEEDWGSLGMSSPIPKDKCWCGYSH